MSDERKYSDGDMRIKLLDIYLNMMEIRLILFRIFQRGRYFITLPAREAI